MKKIIKKRRPPNPRFSLMRFDFKLGKVVIEEPRRPLKAAWEGRLKPGPIATGWTASGPAEPIGTARKQAA